MVAANVMCELVKPGVGLSNLGNKCFANCVLQFMLHSTHITSCVLSHNEAGIYITECMNFGIYNYFVSDYYCYKIFKSSTVKINFSM